MTNMNEIDLETAAQVTGGNMCSDIFGGLSDGLAFGAVVAGAAAFLTAGATAPGAIGLGLGAVAAKAIGGIFC
jgi:hypothetical protein